MFEQYPSVPRISAQLELHLTELGIIFRMLFSCLGFLWRKRSWKFPSLLPGVLSAIAGSSKDSRRKAAWLLCLVRICSRWRVNFNSFKFRKMLLNISVTGVLKGHNKILLLLKYKSKNWSKSLDNIWLIWSLSMKFSPPVSSPNLTCLWSLTVLFPTLCLCFM